MKKYSAALLAVLLGLTFSSCGKGGAPSDVFNRLKGLSPNNIEDAAAVYTAGTMEAIRELKKLLPPDQQKGTDNTFATATWEVIEEKISGDTATVKLKFTSHAKAEKVNAVAPFRLKKEGGAWKLDMEQEMRMALQAIKQMDKMKDMLKQLKGGK